MKKLVFKRLYIFSPQEQLGKMVSFINGLNVITSSVKDGSKRGKSVIMKSLYHTMGADCHFDDRWNSRTKHYILLFSIDEQEYYMYRYNSFFRFFDAEMKLLFSTVNRIELAKELMVYFDFIVQLPGKKDDTLEVAQPAYSYLLYFIDQDHYKGTSFESFKKLDQFTNFKENLLYCHFGAFDQQYFQIEKERNDLTKNRLDTEKKRAIAKGIMDKIDQESVGSNVPLNWMSLQSELELRREEYNNIIKNLDRVKKALIDLRNQKLEYEMAIEDLKRATKDNEKEIESLNRHICPVCASNIEDTVKHRSERYHRSENIALINLDLKRDLADVENEINKKAEEYKDLLALMDSYEEKMKLESKQVEDILRHQGLSQLRDSVITDIGSYDALLHNMKNRMKELSKEKRKYHDKKKSINTLYHQNMLRDRMELGLEEEIKESSFKNIKTGFSGGGSSKTSPTIMWHLNLIKLKNEFNPNAINFPILIDSPNNAETDQEQKRIILEYILKNFSDSNQMIFSVLDFHKEDFDIQTGCNVIFLESEKYHLLNPEDYQKYKNLLDELIQK